LFGVELFMVRDRDSLAPDQIETFHTKSNGRLIFLPFYHIENAFLMPNAIAAVARKILISAAPTADQIEAKMIELARQQLNYTISLYVKNEIYFQAGNFDVSPKITIDQSTTTAALAAAMHDKKNTILAKYNQEFSASEIETRLNKWKILLENSIQNGWSSDARQYFIGKRILKEIQAWLFKNQTILLWEHIIDSDEPECIEACAELRILLNKI
jgi:hypothetical protein